MFLRFSPYVLALVSGLLLSLGFAPYDQAWAGWIALVPLAMVPFLFKISWKEALAVGFVFGLAFFGFTFFWLTEVTGAGWVAVVAILALYPALWSLAWLWITKPLPQELTSTYNLSRALLGSCAWVITEWLRGWVLTGFPWNHLGVTQAKMVAIIQVADLGGVLMVSWLVILLNLILALTFLRVHREVTQKQKARSHYDFSLCLVLLALAFGYGARAVFDRPKPVQNLSYLAVQPDLPQDPWGEGVSLQEAVNRMAQLTLTGLSSLSKQDPGIIIWPETPVGQQILTDPIFRKFLEFITEESGQAFLFGTNRIEGEEVYNSVMLYQPGGEEPEVYRKQHLVIMGEYVPLGDAIPWLRKLVPLGIDYSSGKTSNILTLRQPLVYLAPLICFEDTVVSVVRRFMKNQKVDLFVNMTNDGWFRRSPQSRQHINNALFRCVEFRRPMIRVSNNGVTAVINEKGVVWELLQDPITGSIFEAGVMKGFIPIPARVNTVYAHYGDWVVGVSALALGYFYLRTRKSRHKLKN